MAKETTSAVDNKRCKELQRERYDVTHYSERCQQQKSPALLGLFVKTPDHRVLGRPVVPTHHKDRGGRPMVECSFIAFRPGTLTVLSLIVKCERDNVNSDRQGLQSRLKVLVALDS